MHDIAGDAYGSQEDSPTHESFPGDRVGMKDGTHPKMGVCPTYPTAVAMELQGTFGGPLPPGDKVNLGS